MKGLWPSASATDPYQSRKARDYLDDKQTSYPALEQNNWGHDTCNLDHLNRRSTILPAVQLQDIEQQGCETNLEPKQNESRAKMETLPLA